MPPWSQRLATLRSCLAAEDIHAFLITTPVNIRYLTGFHGSSGWLLVGSDEARLLTDGRYQGLVREGLAAGTIGPVQLDLVDETYDRALGRALAATGATRVGFEGAHVTVAALGRWERTIPGVSWRSTEGIVEAARTIKDGGELSILRRAAGLLTETASNLGTWVLPGRSERAVALDIDRALVDAGFERPAFDTIVASGPNSAYPHARPTDRRLERGDLVVLDFGGVLEGYCVDLTRMAGIGQIGPEVRNLFDAVMVAQQSALRTIRAGVTGEDVDRAARESIGARGLGAAFCHGTGHGLGLEVHEAPRISRPSDAKPVVLQPGMVCTIEPGVYVEGLGGVRLEDDVVVTTEGCDILTDLSRDLLVV